QQLHVAIQQLDEDQRQVVLLHDVEGYTALEASQILGESPGTIKSRLHRARKKLKKFLEEGTFGRFHSCQEARRNAMQCNEVRQQLQQSRIRGLATLAPALRSHLTHCAGCQEFAADLQYRSLLQDLPAPAPREGFAKQALAKAWLAR